MTTPAPTVWPPSRIANRSSFSIAIGVINSIVHVHVVPRHHHLPPLRQRRHSRHVRRPEVELRPVPVEERRVPAPLFLRQHVHLPLELLVRRDRLRRRQHHPALQVLLLDPAQQQPDVVPRLRLVHAACGTSPPPSPPSPASSRIPTISTLSPTFTFPRSTGPSPPSRGP